MMSDAATPAPPAPPGSVVYELWSYGYSLKEIARLTEALDETTLRWALRTGALAPPIQVENSIRCLQRTSVYRAGVLRRLALEVGASFQELGETALANMRRIKR